MRIIKYIPKSTTAKTEYREIREDDLAWIKEQMLRWLAWMGELDTEHDSDLAALRDHWWHKKQKQIPKSRQGPNSPCSFVSGCIKNLIFGEQRDLTLPQTEAIETISLWMAEVFDNEFESIRFQIGF